MRENIFKLDEFRYIADVSGLWYHRKNKEEAKGVVWSLVAAFCDQFNYNYNYLLIFLEELSLSNKMKDYDTPLPKPTPDDFLEILEFRKSEIIRKQNGGESKWDWPKGWNVHWNNGGVSEYYENGKIVKDYKYLLERIENGIYTHKVCHFNHHIRIALTDQETSLISSLLNEFAQIGCPINYRYVIQSYDLPSRLKVNTKEIEGIKWDFDGLLGEYGVQTKKSHIKEIQIYNRAIEKCSKFLNVSPVLLRETTILHEYCHYAFQEIPYGKSYKERAEFAEYNMFSIEIHEGVAQLLTWLILEYRHKREVFDKLNERQSIEYKVYKEILELTTDRKMLIESVVELRKLNDPEIDDWKGIVERIKAHNIV